MLAGLLIAANAAATPITESTRIVVNAGWRYTPNATFERQASNNGYALAGPAIGGPAGLLTFAYQYSQVMDIAIEVGFGAQRLKFSGGAPDLWLEQVPLLIDVRYWFADWRWASAYVGGGAGYLLNFWVGGPFTYSEAHTVSPVVILGLVIPVCDAWSLVVEDRETLARSIAGTVGAAQVGGNTLTIGVQYSLGPATKSRPF